MSLDEIESAVLKVSQEITLKLKLLESAFSGMGLITPDMSEEEAKETFTGGLILYLLARLEGAPDKIAIAATVSIILAKMHDAGELSETAKRMIDEAMKGREVYKTREEKK
jgi:hypothetical protein